jgi:hypothetical protein
MTKLVALAAAAGMGALAYSQLPEFRRYLKIRQM